MSIFNRVPILRWIVPAAATALVIGGGALVANSPADASPPLAPRSAAQLLVDIQQASVTGLSGTVVQSSDLGLPTLPGLGLGGDPGSANLTSLLAGTHTLRLWYAGPHQLRVAVLGSLGESDVIRNGNDLWTWSSKDNTATHRTLSSDEPGSSEKSDSTDRQPGSGVLPAISGMTPQQAADAALAAISPSTKVTTDGSAEVAGRSAYELVLTPKTAGSLVAQVRIAVDATEHIPLRVQVFATGQPTPAIQVAFSAVDFNRPDAAQFAFNPPPGATVTEQDSSKPSAADRAKERKAATSKAAGELGAPKIVGSGWSTVLVMDASSGLGALTGRPGPAKSSDASPSPSPTAQPPGAALGGILTALPKVSGSWGSGHLLRSKLFSAVITDNGKIAVGAVAPDLLYTALSQ
ncbi:LolA family protein [Nakamurella lactea]|uniref:LolA family protein n=1 Tax=Nakamurella lactea TaxID=459515 RepID=UPI000424B607|nr:hypothetical protein [Nakamurella lactea]